MRKLFMFTLFLSAGFAVDSHRDSVEIEEVGGASLYEQNNPYGGYQVDPWPSVKEKSKSKDKEEKDYTDVEEKESKKENRK